MRCCTGLLVASHECLISALVLSETHITVPLPFQSGVPWPFSSHIQTCHPHSSTYPQSVVNVGCLEYKFLESLDFHLVFLLWHSQYLECCLAHSILTITIWDLRELYLSPYKHLCPSDLPQAFIMWTRCILYSLLGSFMVWLLVWETASRWPPVYIKRNIQTGVLGRRPETFSLSHLYWTSEIHLRRMLRSFSGRLAQGSGSEKATSLLEPRKSLFVFWSPSPSRLQPWGSFVHLMGKARAENLYSHPYCLWEWWEISCMLCLGSSLCSSSPSEELNWGVRIWKAGCYYFFKKVVL